jgi:hypothetical protein
VQRAAPPLVCRLPPDVGWWPRPPLLLPLAEARDEAAIGLDARAAGATELEGLVVGHAVLAYKVRDHNCGRARDALVRGSAQSNWMRGMEMKERGG